MKMRLLTAATGLFLIAGCATVDMPEIPEYHPAHPEASAGYIESSFKVLTIEPQVPPNLPVPEGEQKPAADKQKNMGGMQHDAQQPMKHDGMPAPPPEAHAEDKQDALPTWGEALDEELHGEIRRPGMQEAMPAHGAGPEGLQDENVQDRAWQQRIDDDVKRGEAKLDPVVIPREQRGMGADSTLYHEHEAQYSTKIVHPHRADHLTPIVGPQLWVCPRHPDVAVHTPGGRCPYCQTILVPVKVDNDD